jgi:hypothetical protein
MATLQGQTRRGYLHDIPVSWLYGGVLAPALRFWLEAHDSPYRKLHYTDDAGVRWSFRMKNR